MDSHGATPLPAQVPEPGGAEDPCRSLYRERALLIAHLTTLYPSVYAYSDPEWPTWPVVYLETPLGQMSWHITPADFADFFSHVRHDPDVLWDGHSTDEKLNRLANLTTGMAALPRTE